MSTIQQHGQKIQRQIRSKISYRWSNTVIVQHLYINYTLCVFFVIFLCYRTGLRGLTWSLLHYCCRTGGCNRWGRAIDRQVFVSTFTHRALELPNRTNPRFSEFNALALTWQQRDSRERLHISDSEDCSHNTVSFHKGKYLLLEIGLYRLLDKFTEKK